MRERPAGFGEDVLTRLKNGAAVRAPDYARAVRREAELIRALDLYFSDVDLVLTPTTRVPAPRFQNVAVALSQDLTAFTAPFNLSGFPAISVPCGFTRAGLPIGMQLVARPWNEALTLRAANEYQQATSWHRRVPPLD